MKLEFSASITAADQETRTLTGVVVPFGREGRTSMGPVVFEVGSITNLEAASNIRLLMEHDRTRPVGKWISLTPTPTGIVGTAKVSATTAGNDLLVEAIDGIRDGFSIGATINKHEMRKREDGKTVMHVLDATLEEISAVAHPAFDDARVVEIAASEPDEAESTEGDTVNPEDQVTQVEETAETVEASSPKPVQASAPIYTKPRLELTKVKYLEHSLKASALGDEESRSWLRAADNETTTAVGMIPTPQMTNVLNFIGNADRPMIDSISRGPWVPYGSSWEIPNLTVLPSVDQVDENDPITESTLESNFITVTKKSFKGRAIATLELIAESNPAFLAELMRQLEAQFASETDQWVTTQIQSAGTLNGTAQANSATGLLGYVSSAAAAVYKATLGFGRNMVVTADQWANIMSYNDNGRPIYIAAQPSNAGGALSATSLRGSVAGLDLRVSATMKGSGGDGKADYSMVVINPDAYTWYEGPRQELRTNVNSDGTVDVLMFGQGALATKKAAGANWFNLS